MKTDGLDKESNYIEKLDYLEQELKSIEKLIENTLINIEKEKKSNKKLENELLKLNNELSKVKKNTEKLAKERDLYLNKYNAIHKSRIWKQANLIRRVIRKLKKILFVNNGSGVGKEKSIIPIKKAEKKIKKYKLKLLNLGITERTERELQEIVSDDNEPNMQRLAARELVLFYANKRNVEGAKMCLDLLPIARNGEEDKVRVSQLDLLEAECYVELGEVEKAKKIISESLDNIYTADLMFVGANLKSSIEERFEEINKVFKKYKLATLTYNQLHKYEYDCISVNKKDLQYISATDETPKVTVIMPVYNAGDYINTAIESIMSQTWGNIEILVVDDCSTDNTKDIVSNYIKRDPRIRLIQTETNGGAYFARNLAISQATGDFVTLNDSDDWSHPQKIEVQVKHLIENPNVIGNTSQQIRATNELKFFRRGNYRLMFTNMSSFMFRRELVVGKLGYYDCVRFGADAEYLRRIRKVFGKDAIVDLKTGPLSFQRQSSSSLTGNSAFGYHGFFMGCRKEYVEAQTYYHQNAGALFYEYRQIPRKFPVPEPMWPIREEKDFDGRRLFDTVIIGDYRNPGDILKSIIKTKLNSTSNQRIGLVQMYLYDLDPAQKVCEEIRELIDGDKLHMLVYGEKVVCNNLVISDHRLLKDRQKYIPTIEAKDIKVVISVDKNANSPLMLNEELLNLKNYFGQKGTWIPKDERVRGRLTSTETEVEVASENWSDMLLQN